MAREVALTTADNPYDPIDQYDQWYAFDTQKGYCTDAYIARIMKTSDEFSEEEQKRDFENAINEILFYDLTGNYRKVVKEA